MQTIRLPRLRTFEAWREAARSLAGQNLAADQVAWAMEDDTASLFDRFDPPPPAADTKLTVPKSFPSLAKQLCAHRAPGTFDLAYRLLLRVSAQPNLLANRADPDVSKVEERAKNIRRDMHKMKAFVRFREVSSPKANRRQFVSWFEPDHRIEELIGGFFARRFGDMDWVIVTPEVTMRFENGDVRYEAIKSARPDLNDETEELWRTYYANIFNPARLKFQAMQSEMPKKYWKNLPEATLIPELIAHAEAQVQEMRAAAPTLPPLRAERVLERLHTTEGSTNGVCGTLANCTRCPLAGPATQAVGGEGPQDATIMLVGEQPGDEEDLAGRPFVGPAGQVLDDMMKDVGLSRSELYLTNAVKHFKFTVRGKRRIHQSPSAAEIDHCRWWLDAEIAEVKPQLIVALGATAAKSLTGDGRAILERRGKVEIGLAGVPVLITLHPAALLRQPNQSAKDAMLSKMRQDLKDVAQLSKSDAFMIAGAWQRERSDNRLP